MKLHKLAGLGIASVVVLTAVGSTVINTSPAFANHSTADVKGTNKSVVAHGSFVKQEKSTRGMAKIVSINGKRYLEFDRSFRTGSGPDVKVILHRQSNVPLNIRERDYVTLAPIKSFKGTQRYAIPENINLNQFKSVGIWCQQFNATFGYAPLRGV
ncbi:MAG: DM13 domain-containing protein [Calothrix sp. MO_192.B10]|nr:DM13 domain-containing protein [Calothrix sp. MO_192.B10]